MIRLIPTGSENKAAAQSKNYNSLSSGFFKLNIKLVKSFIIPVWIKCKTTFIPQWAWRLKEENSIHLCKHRSSHYRRKAKTNHCVQTSRSPDLKRHSQLLHCIYWQCFIMMGSSWNYLVCIARLSLYKCHKTTKTNTALQFLVLSSA